jgi:hypothetical protein
VACFSCLNFVSANCFLTGVVPNQIGLTLRGFAMFFFRGGEGVCSGVAVFCLFWWVAAFYIQSLFFLVFNIKIGKVAFFVLLF